MVKYIIKSSLFIFPFILLYVWNVLYYDVNGNDLIRLGYIPDFYKKTKTRLNRLNERKCYYKNYYTDKLQNEYDFLILGDSFSDGLHSYSNKLAKKYKVLVLDGQEIQNPLQRLIYLINSDFFYKYKIKNIILESVERSVIERSIESNFKKCYKFNLQTQIIKNNQSLPSHSFFSNQSLLFGYYSLKYLIFKNGVFNEVVYKYELSKDLFSSPTKKNILVINQDITNLILNQNKFEINKLNVKLNKINTKLERLNIRFYFMICPDKFDFYYDYILKKNTSKPFIIEYLDNLPKKYNFINTKKILHYELKNNTKDIYYFDDTHWSPIAIKIISDSLNKMIKPKNY